jgi:hypothetical protein
MSVNILEEVVSLADPSPSGPSRTEAPPSQAHRPSSFPPQQRGRSKRKFPTGKKAQSSKKPKPAGSSNQPASQPSVLAHPIVRHFPIWTANFGALRLCEVVFHSIQGRDNRMAQLLSIEQLFYVTILSFWYRTCMLGHKFGYRLEANDLSTLKRVAESIYLPSLCRRFVDSIGTYQLPSGAVIAPYVCTLEEANEHADLFTPHDALHLAQRPIPDNIWGIDYQWVQNWNQNTTRASRDALGFSKMSDSLEGSSEFSCSYTDSERRAGFIEPLAPFALPRTELDLGAAFRYRNYHQVADWLGEYNYIVYPTHTGEEFEFAQLLADRVVANIVDRH